MSFQILMTFFSGGDVLKNVCTALFHTMKVDGEKKLKQHRSIKTEVNKALYVTSLEKHTLWKEMKILVKKSIRDFHHMTFYKLN